MMWVPVERYRIFLVALYTFRCIGVTNTNPKYLASYYWSLTHPFGQPSLSFRLTDLTSFYSDHARVSDRNFDGSSVS